MSEERGLIFQGGGEGTAQRGPGSDPTESADPGVRTESTTYDPTTAQVAGLTSPEGTIRYDYDLVTGRKTRMYTDNNDTSYGYDDLGRLNSVKVTKLNGVTLTGADVQETKYTYNVVGNLSTVTLPNGVVTTYTYDALNRLDLETVAKVTPGPTLSAPPVITPVASYDYDVRSDGHRTGVTETANNADGSVFSTTRIDWAYDALKRLASETYTRRNASGAVVEAFRDTYLLDPANNRVGKVHDAGNDGDMSTPADVTTTATYDARDQLTTETITPGGGATATTSAYTYDANGSPTTVVQTGATTSTTVNTYDLRNRLIAIDKDGDGVVDVRLAYATDGARVSETAGGVTRTDLIDRQGPTGYAQTIEERTNGVLTRSYIEGLDIIGQSDANGIAYLGYDGHGSTRFLTDPSGAVLTTGTPWLNYDAFGLPVAFDPATASTPLLYNGERWSIALGQYYFRARDYRPEQGRFPTRDSYVPGVGELADWNGYVFVAGDGVNATDPTGMFGFADILTAAGNTASLISRLAVPVLRGYSFVTRLRDTVHALETFRDVTAALIDGDLEGVGEFITDYLYELAFNKATDLVVSTTFRALGPLGKSLTHRAATVLAASASLKVSRKTIQDTRDFFHNNKRLNANKIHSTGIRFDKSGFPDFSAFLYKGGPNTVKITLTGSRRLDERVANSLAGYSKTPDNYTWHHHQKLGVMELVLKDVHVPVGHVGGAGLWATLHGLTKYGR